MKLLNAERYSRKRKMYMKVRKKPAKNAVEALKPEPKKLEIRNHGRQFFRKKLVSFGT